jgi:uncharacterized protein YunC (DUF1805 family)
MKISELKNYKVVKSGTGVPQAEVAPAPSFAERTSGVINRRGNQLYESITGTGTDAGKTPLRRGFEAVAETASAVPELALEASPAIVREPIKAVGEGVSNAFKTLTDFIGSNPDLQDFVIKNPKLVQAIEESAGTLSAAGEISGNILGASGTAGATSVVANQLKNVPRGTQGIITRSKNIITPEPKPVEAVGEVLQGKTTDIKPAVRALDAVDIEGVKTFQQLKEKMDASIKTLSEQVDDELAKDTSVTPLDALITTSKTKGGSAVERNFVADALSHLSELYGKTADDLSLAEITELTAKAMKTGLTKQEINDISRIYGQEFGRKAFSKMGDPLTSVNAQMFENIRTGLKDVARSGIGGDAAKAADATISSLYNTRTLIEKNVEAVQKLQQRISERGLLEKAGHAISKYADILTGGSIRGLIGGLLPRGAGYKVLNALDLEERLQKNLEIIKKAIETKSDSEVIKLLEELGQKAEPTSPAKSATVSSGNTNTKLKAFREGKPNSEAGFVKNPVANTNALRELVTNQNRIARQLLAEMEKGSINSAKAKQLRQALKSIDAQIDKYGG